MAAKQEGMLVKCQGCGAIYNYQSLMASKPRMDKVEFVEKQPPGTQTVPLWLHPEVVAALQAKFPSNLLTTLHSAVTALADPDSVLIEGQYAREMAQIGVRKGREVLALAKEVKELRDEVAAMKLREQTLRQFFSGLGLAMPALASQSANQPANDLPAQLPVDERGNPLTPPRAQFSQLQDDGSGLLVPADGTDQMQQPASQFTFPADAAPAADTRPAFVTTNLR
jgi:hypothetical protein